MQNRFLIKFVVSLFLIAAPISAAHGEEDLFTDYIEKMTPFTVDFFEPKTTDELEKKIENELKGKGVWSYEFVLVTQNQSNIILSESDKHRAMIPASTLKLFTGWVGFKENLRSDDYLSEMLQRSDNDKANSVLKSIGGPKVLDRKITDSIELFDNGRGFDVKDGSGYSERNQVTANGEFRLLRKIFLDKEYQTFKRFMAQPKGRGTLRYRLHQYAGDLYAKTGTLPQTGVVSLAGFLETKRGTMLFSILGNEITKSVRKSRKVIDRIVEMHGDYLNRP